jgi:RNA polymerase sigma-70 factor (ECF subfamily)
MNTGRLRLIPPPTRTDGELCRAFLSGDGEAFGELVQRHQGAVYRLVRRYASSPDDALDLAQRAFLQAFEAARRALPRLLRDDGEVPFRAWLLRIAINLGKNQVRDRARWLAAPAEAIDREPSGRPSAQDALERAQAEALTRRAVLRLPRRQREVLTLRIDAGLPFAEIAVTLGITEGNAKAHFHYAAKRLKSEVETLASRSSLGGAP